MIRSDRPDPVRGFLTRGARSGWIPAAAWWVDAGHGRSSRGAVGRIGSEPGSDDCREQTPFDLASLTKPLCTALLLALLEREGSLDLDGPVSDWIDAFAGTGRSGTTLLELSAHVAGLPPWRPLYLHATGIDETLHRIAEEPRAVPAGRTLYSDLGYIVLGAVLERAAGEPLDRLFARRVSGPLGLPRIGFASGDRSFGDAAPTERGNAYERQLAGPAAPPHPWRTAELRGEVHDANAYRLGGIAGHAGLFGTAAEVAAIAREIHRPARLPLDHRGRARLIDPVPGSDGRTVGMVHAAFSAAARGILPDAAPGHTGFTGTSVWMDPPTDRLFVLLTNRVHPEVRARDFQRFRRGFHRAASALSKT